MNCQRNHARLDLARTAGLVSLITLFAAGCPKKTADWELEAARKAMLEAQAKRANDCAKETFQAAEAAIAEARELAKNGEIQKAKEKAMEAKMLAEQANAASKPGCADKKAEDEPKEGERDDQNAAANAKITEGEILETIYFDYNDAAIREDSKAVLSRVADVMTKSKGLQIEIEGHCDVRGSTEYNLQLGERRARSVEKYLTTQGVSPKQLQIISYGEERPVDLGNTEQAHQRNRRAELHKLK